MSDAQKVIKYVAISLAVLLIVTIISSLVYLFNALGNTFSLDKEYNDNLETINFNEEINNITIDLISADLTVKYGTQLKIEINSNINYTIDDNLLLIKENKNNFLKNRNNLVTLYIPSDKVYDDVKISNGAGIISIEKISANNLNLNLGAGKVEIDNLETYTSTLIDGGAGKIDINNGLISYLNFDMGVGEVNLTARVLGKSEIDCGIGAANINLLGNSNDYQIDVDKGIGEFTIDNVSVHDEDIYGSGINSLDVDGGLGKVTIKFINNR